MEYAFKRLIQIPIILFFLLTASFFLIRLAPGSPFSSDRYLDPEIERALQDKYHLNETLLQQYIFFWKNLLQGDLGPSLKHKNRTVNEIIAATLPVSLLLGSLAFFFAVCFGVGIGIFTALRFGSIIDYISMSVAMVAISVPMFVTGPLLQIMFAMKHHWFPLAGYDGIASPSYLILPSITLAIPFAARIARLTRAGMLEILQQDFVLCARAKGLPEYSIIFRHTLRGGLLPVISYLGPAFASMATGSLVIEKIFQIPGLGREFVESALNRDYTLVMGTVIVYGTLILCLNVLVDILYGVLDPRIGKT